MRAKSTTEKVFDEILAFLDGAFERPDFSAVMGRVSRKQRRVEEKERHRRRRALRSLQQQGFIRFTGRGDLIRVGITLLGRHHAIVREAARCTKILPVGRWVFVIFDIPEDRRVARRALSRFLHAMNGERIQKSVWRTNRDVGAILTKLIRLHRAERFVRIIVGRDITEHKNSR